MRSAAPPGTGTAGSPSCITPATAPVSTATSAGSREFGELRGHASIALAGHDHDMQRLHPIDGITPFVDGAGGQELYPVNRDDPRLAFFDETHHGALRIKLGPGRAVLSFVAQNGTTLDRSPVTCRQG